METLSESELDHLWKLTEGHVPGEREEFTATLRAMAAISAITVKVTPARVEVKMPLKRVAFDRRNG